MTIPHNEILNKLYVIKARMKKYADTYPITKKDYEAVVDLIEKIEDKPREI